MRWLLCVVLSSLAVALGCSPSRDQCDEKIQTAIETAIPAIDLAAEGSVPWAKLLQYEGAHTLAERMDHYRVPGLSIAVVDDFKLAWAGTYGMVEATGNDSVTTNTLFEAGSTTKAVTALATLRLGEEGVLDLDTDVNRYLVSWHVPPNEFTVTEKVTAYRLLTHTAGINRPDGGFSLEEGSKPTTVQVLRGERPAQNDPLRVESVPGTRHRYSNFGYVVLQQALEDLKRGPFQAIVRTKVFEPAGMMSSTFDPLGSDLPCATPHTASGEARASYVHPSALAQGELRTTASDLARLAIEVMKSYRGDSDVLVKEATARRMLAVQTEVDPEENMGFTKEGLGVFLLDTEAGMAFCHPGYNEPGATTLWLGVPETGQAVVVMTNGARGLELSMEILSCVTKVCSWPQIEPPR